MDSKRPEDMTDEELWNSPVGQRVRTYGDKLMLAEAERITAFHRRQVDSVVAAGINRGRAIISLDDGGDPDAVLRPDVDPWAYWQSPEAEGLRAAVKDTDGTIKAAQEAAKAYIASLSGEERPAPDDEQAPADDTTTTDQPMTLTEVTRPEATPVTKILRMIPEAC